jgi:uncharacterized protein (DUF2141 family)
MNRVLLVVVFAACGPAPTETPVFTPTITLPEGRSSLTVTIERVKVGKGPLFCDLFNAGEGFPGPSPIIGGSIRLTADQDRPTCTWEKLPAGSYAVSVIQDENANGSLDSNAFGAPTEGYGVSNNVIPATSAPKWSDSQVTIDGEAPLAVTVSLKN